MGSGRAGRGPGGQWLRVIAVCPFRPVARRRFFGHPHPVAIRQSHHLGSLLALALPLGMAGFVRASSWQSRLLGLVVVGLLYSGILLVGSRGAWLAAGSGLLVVLIGWIQHKCRATQVVGVTWLVGLAGQLLLLTLLWSQQPVLPGEEKAVSVGERLLSSSRVVGAQADVDVSIHHRYFIWAVTWEMIGEKPLLGQGYGTYAARFPLVRERLEGDNWPEYPNVEFAHNDLAHIWAESGLLGLLGFVGLVGIVLYRGVSAGRRFEIWAGMGLVAAVLIHGLVSYPLHLPLSGAVFWLALGWLARVGDEH
ncbi:MAG: hypothetical protein GKR89_03825 [Candidatus Latescibacteria bacterium]|nr:hypothetical protein [Candidatus Latescibacterota bacterium]